MTSAKHWAVLLLALLVACPPISAEAEPKAEAAAEAKPVYDADASTRSSSRFGGSRSLNLGLARDNDYQTQTGLGSLRTGQFGTTNQFGLNSQLGSTGYQADQFGANRFGGTSQFGTSGLRNNQFGTNHFGADGLGSSQFGTNGFGTNRFGTGGLATSRFGGSGLTSNNQFGRNQFGVTGLRNNQFGTNQFGTTGFGVGTSQFGSNQNTRFGTNQFGTSGYGNNQLGINRFGSNQFNRNGFQSGLATEGGILNQRSENDGAGQYSFAYETENGITHEEAGQPQGLGSYGVRGSYSYTSPEGVPVSVSYIADENGFQVDSPNVPAIPEHSQRQILAAEELRRQGLVDNLGNVLTDQQNQFQTSNLHNLVGQNRNAFGTGGRFSGTSNYAGVGGFNRNNPAGFGSQGYTSPISSGNFLGTTVVRRRLPHNLDEASIAAFNRQALQNYGRDDIRGSLFIDDQRLLNDNRFLQGGLYNQNNFGRFGQNYRLGQAGYSTLGPDSDRDFERIIETLDQRLRDRGSRRFSGRDGRSGTRFGEYTSQGFLSPVFQQQTASRLGIQEGGNSRQPFGRLLNLQRYDDDLNTHSDLYHASDLTTGVGGSGASHVFKS